VAASYGVIAGSTVTNTRPSVINGDLAISPGAALVLAVDEFARPSSEICHVFVRSSRRFMEEGGNDLCITSVAGTKRTCRGRLTISAPEGKTDVPREPGHFRF
jgi:hypothetical protein